MSDKTLSAIRIMFFIFLTLGIFALILSNAQVGDTGAGWGFAFIAIFSLLVAVILLPLVIVFSIRKRTKK